MKPAFQKDGALLADIAQARRSARPKIWWLGQSGFLLWAGGKTVLFDPYLSDSLTRKYAATDKPHTRITEQVIAPDRLSGVDLVTCSHNHTDHLDKDTMDGLLEASPAAKLLIPRANRSFVLERLGPKAEPKLLEIDAGETLTVDGIRVTGIPAAHNEVEKDPAGRCKFLGYVAQVGNLSVYHSGDTLRHDGLIPALKPFSLDLVLVPINGNKPERRVAGNMDAREAAALSKAVAAKLAIPHHFDMFEFNTASPEEFEIECQRVGQAFRILRNGEGVEL